MGLFIISFCLVFVSSYFLASIFNKEKNVFGLIYIFLFAFANIILTMEVLSLFSAISVPAVLGTNIGLFLVSILLWNKFERPLWKINLGEIFRKFLNAIKLDKALLLLTFAYVFFICCTLFMCVFYPVINPDAAAYHVLRSLFWIQNKNLSHFLIADSRCLHLPINSELLYTWILMFLKKEIFLAFPSFCGYLISMISTYKILDVLKYSMRKKLWVIYILSSLAFVIVQASSTETDIIIAGLVSSSIVMFIYALKERKEIPLIMSALAYSIAIGVKTPAIFAIPAIGVGFTIYSYYKCGKKEFYKPLLRFLGYGLIFFVIFSMYNYLQNLIEWGNVAGSRAFLSVHRNNEGLKAIPATFIKHIFLYIDFTGFTWGIIFGKYVLGLRDFLINHLTFFNPADGAYTTEKVVNQSLLEPLMGPGILGILVLIPCTINSLIKPIFKKNKKNIILGFFGTMLVANIVIMSYCVPFMTFSVRFLMFFTVISAPVLVYSFKKRGFYRWIIVFFALFYLIVVSTHLWARNLTKLARAFKAGVSISTARALVRCSGLPPAHIKFSKEQYEHISKRGKCSFENEFKKHVPSGNKVLIFSNQVDELLDFKLNQFYGYTIDTNLLENLDNINLDNYDTVIVIEHRQNSTTFTRFATHIPIPEGVDCVYLTSVKLSDSSKQYPSGYACKIKQDYFLKHGFNEFVKIKYSLIPNSQISKTENIDKYAYVYTRKSRK